MKTTKVIFSNLVIALFIAGCSSSSITTPQEQNANEGIVDPGEDPEAAAGTNTLGVKNYKQIYETMSTLSKTVVVGSDDDRRNVGIGGLPGDNNTINELFNGTKASFPSDENITAFNSTHMLAITNLAFRFCRTITQDGTTRGRFFTAESGIADGTINQEFNTDNAVDNAKRDAFVLYMVNAIWGEIPDATEEQAAQRSEELSQMRALLDTLIEGYNANNRDDARRVKEGVCTALMASGHVILL